MLFLYLTDHELWWLNGHFHDRHTVSDTKQRVFKTVNMVVEDIKEGNVVGAYVHHSHGVPILFVHAGFRKDFYRFMQSELYPNAVTSEVSAVEIANYTNNLLNQFINNCDSFPCADFTHELFQAGPDRGGRGIGGPL